MIDYFQKLFLLILFIAENIRKFDLNQIKKLKAKFRLRIRVRVRSQIPCPIINKGSG